MPSAPGGGRKGQTMGRVHDVFHERLADLRLQAQQIQQAIQGAAQRPWQVPANFTGSLLDVPELHNPAFNRDEINANYEEVTKDPKNAGTVGDVIGLKLQLDYVACEERAFRARHTTLARAMCLGHGRRFGQGQGSLWGDKDGIEAVVSSFISAGGAATSSTGGTVP